MSSKGRIMGAVACLAVVSLFLWMFILPGKTGENVASRESRAPSDRMKPNGRSAHTIFEMGDRGYELEEIFKGRESLVTEPDVDGKFWLHTAVKYGRENSVIYLTQIGADPNDSRDGLTPYEMAIASANKPLVSILQQVGGRSEQDVALASMSAERRPILSMLLSQGSDPNRLHSVYEEYPLHMAARWSDAEAVSLLLRYGAQVNALNSLGRTALDEADYRGSAEISRILIQAGGANGPRKQR